METVLLLAIFLFSVILHEVSHGYMALALGDPTAKQAGRLTLNPVSHLDMFGSILLPFLLYISGSRFLFGWAKPVPVDARFLRGGVYGMLKVALAGPVSNISLALVFGTLLRTGLFPWAMADVMAQVVYINLMLAVFNLVPIPPLDGSHILFAFLPPSLYHVKVFLARYGVFLLLAFIFFAFRALSPVISFLFGIFTGI